MPNIAQKHLYQTKMSDIFTLYYSSLHRQQEKRLNLSKTRAVAFSSVLLIIRDAFIKSLTRRGMWSSVQWKSSHYLSTVQELSSTAPTLDTEPFSGKIWTTSYWKGDFGCKIQRSALVGCTANGVLRNLKLEHYWPFFLISNREKSLIFSFFISTHKKRERDVSYIPSNFSGTTQVSS